MGSRQSISKRKLVITGLKNAVHGFTTEYETPKMVLIHSFKFAMMLRVLQCLILAYSVVYLIWYEKGYQKKDSTVISSITLKVKGIGYIPAPQNRTTIVDGADYIIPPSENNAIFIMTNFVQTDQNRSICAESISIKEAKCGKDSDCQTNVFIPSANGKWTGRCVLPENLTQSNETNAKVGLCEMSAWCPPENDRLPSKLVDEVFNFTVFVKNFVEFPEFRIVRANLDENLKQCIYDAVHNKDCPIFRLGDIIDTAEPNATERKLMLELGGVVRVKLDWDCNFDRSAKLCKPVYSFGRLDLPFSQNPFSKGFNFRYAWYWARDDRQYRTLVKAFGLRLIIVVSGKGGKFDLITLTLNIGSIVGIFGLATYFCDIFLLHLSKRSRTYRGCVFQQVHLKTRSASVTDDPRRPLQSLMNKLAPKSPDFDMSSLQSLPMSANHGESLNFEATLHPNNTTSLDKNSLSKKPSTETQ